MKVEEFADIAFSAKSMPSFGYGCAVFMQSDIVNFQRQGWRSEEILAGLADVLPENVFLYVASIPNLAALGTRFVLQGGTQNTLAVVKAEVGVFESGKLTRMCVRLPVLQEFTGNPHRLSQIYIKVDNPAHTQDVIRELRKLLSGYPIYSMEEFSSLLSINSIGLLRNFIGVVIAIAIIVGFIVVSMAMYTAVLERTREIGILRSLGASSPMIFNLLLKETLILSIVGTALGIALTHLAQWFLENIGHSGLTQETIYTWWPIAGFIAITGAVLGTLAPAFKAIHQEVIAALAYE